MCVQVIYNLLLGLNKTCWVRAKSRLKKCVGHAIKLKCEIVSYAKWQKITRGKSSLAQEALYCVCNKLKKTSQALDSNYLTVCLKQTPFSRKEG